MKAENDINVNAALGKTRTFPSKLEIAIPDGVKSKDILGVIPVNLDGTIGNFSILNPERYK